MYEMTQDKVYLVTGAAGFLGGTICRELLESGAYVRALVLPNDRLENMYRTALM